VTRFWAWVSASDVRYNSATLSSHARSAASKADWANSNSDLASSRARLIGFLPDLQITYGAAVTAP
jgi:hypothetical protein